MFDGFGDDDGSIVKYVWKSDLDGELYNGTQDTFKTSGLSLGTHTITLQVQDDDGAWSSPVTDSLKIHEKPTAGIISISPSPALEGKEVMFDGFGDDDGSIVKYVWESHLDGELYNGTQDTFKTSELSLGTHTITLRVQDDDGAWTGPVTDSLKIHEKPTAGIISISPSPALEGKEVMFDGFGDDDGSIVRYVWKSDFDGELYNGTPNTLKTAELSLGTHTITFWVEDEQGAWSKPATTTLTIHRKPTAEIVSISPNPALNIDSIHFEGNGTDDGTIEAYDWRIANETGAEVYNGTTPPATQPVGTYTIYLRVQDNYGVWSDEVSENLIVHQKPTASITSILPTPAFDTDTVTFTGETSDDGTITTHVWISSLDGEIRNGTEANFTNSSLSIGTHTITFKVQDNYGVWSEETTTSLSITKYVAPNKLPTVTITSPVDGAELKGTVIIKGSASDSDGTVEKVELWVDGEWFLATGTTSWDFELDTTQLENWEYVIKVLAFDGTDYSNDTLLNLRVNNEKEDDGGDGEAGFLPGFEIISFFLILACCAFVFRKKRQ